MLEKQPLDLDYPKPLLVRIEPLIRTVCFCLFMIGVLIIVSYPLGCQYIYNTGHSLVIADSGIMTLGYMGTGVLTFLVVLAGAVFAFSRAFPALFPGIWKSKG